MSPEHLRPNADAGTSREEQMDEVIVRLEERVAASAAVTSDLIEQINELSGRLEAEEKRTFSARLSRALETGTARFAEAERAWMDDWGKHLTVGSVGAGFGMSFGIGIPPAALAVATTLGGFVLFRKLRTMWNNSKMRRARNAVDTALT